jgi:hypothetical protein
VRTVSSGGIDTQYEGVWLHEILKKAGLPAGEALHGKMLTTYVLAEAQDGYQVVFSLGEVDPALGDTPILVADKANGKGSVWGERRVSYHGTARQARRPVRKDADENRSCTSEEIN